MACGDRAVVLIQPLLLGLKQIRRHHHQPIGTGILGRLDEIERQPRAIAHPGDDRQPSAGLFHGGAHQRLVLGQVQRIKLAGAAAHEQAGWVVAGHILDMLTKARQIDLIRRSKRRDWKRQQALELAGQRLSGDWHGWCLLQCMDATTRTTAVTC